MRQIGGGRCDTCGRLGRVYMCEYVCICVYVCISVYMCVTRAADEGGGVTRAADWWGEV